MAEVEIDGLVGERSNERQQPEVVDKHVVADSEEMQEVRELLNGAADL